MSHTLRNKSAVLGLLLAMLLPLAALAASPTSTTDTAEQIKTLDRELNRAFATHDTSTVDRTLLPEFVLITSSGMVRTKPQILKEVGMPELAFTTNESTEVTVRVVGETAVLTGLLHQVYTYEGKEHDYRVWYTDTWVRVDGTWKQLSGHASRYPEKK